METTHSPFIRRTLELAKIPANKVGRNPNVGALIVYDGKIIGEGFHVKFGDIHAEADAINKALKYQHLFPDCTFYSSLEPCNYKGKQPACTGLIFKYGFKKLVVGCADPNPKMQGKSYQQLRANGIELITGIEEEKAKETIRFFTTTEIKKRPYIYLKYAQDKNGYLGNSEKQIQISRPETQVLTHKLRSEVDAIICGVNTVNLDNPQLNCRAYKGDNPLRVIIDPNNRISPKSKVLNDSSSTLHCAYESSFQNALKLENGEVSVVKQVIDHLFKLGISRVLVEGGAKTHKAFLKENLWDEAVVITSDQVLDLNIKAPTIQGKLSKCLKIKTDKIDFIRASD